MKKDTYMYCEDLDEVCEYVNHNFSVLERKIKRANKRVNNAYLLIGGAVVYMYCKFSNALENLKIKFGDF